MQRDMKNAFSPIDDSEDNYQYEENNINSLKLQNYLEDEFYTPSVKNDENFLNIPRRKKDKKKRKKIENEPKRTTNRKIVNLPASQPYIKIIDGEERLAFKYNTKISESALNSMPKDSVEENEFCVRFDLESVDITKLNEKFKADNCVYPRANIPFERYTGNRWNYETECNRLAWQFVSLNPVLLYGKKGLIQRAVDSYRNINKTTKTGKYFKDEYFLGDIEKRKHILPKISSIMIEFQVKGVLKKCKIQVGIENINYEKIPSEFKSKYSVLPEEFDENSFGNPIWKGKNEDNFIAIKIAYLNVENTSFQNAIKMIGISNLLKLSVEAYKNKKHEQSSTDDEDAADVVDKALNNAFTKMNGLKEENFFFRNKNINE